MTQEEILKLCENVNERLMSIDDINNIIREIIKDILKE